MQHSYTQVSSFGHGLMNFKDLGLLRELMHLDQTLCRGISVWVSCG